MRRYETIFIVPADLAEDELNGLVERYEAIITDLKGTFIMRESWGKRKLAYEIKKQTRGFYTLLDFAATSAAVDELERKLRLDDKVLKYMTVKKEEKIDLQKIRQEMTASQPEKKEAATLEITPSASAEDVPEGKKASEETVNETETVAQVVDDAPESQVDAEGGKE